MNTRKSKVWTASNLVPFSYDLGLGYAPGLSLDGVAGRDRWTAERHIQVSALLSHSYNPGF